MSWQNEQHHRFGCTRTYVIVAWPFVGVQPVLTCLAIYDSQTVSNASMATIRGLAFNCDFELAVMNSHAARRACLLMLPSATKVRSG
eukprot:6175357-Pleurochrysis_carterae.AAC.1